MESSKHRAQYNINRLAHRASSGYVAEGKLRPNNVGPEFSKTQFSCCPQWVINLKNNSRILGTETP
jgi:hypothetical protein